MAHFIAYAQGNRGKASRLGDTVIDASAQGWNCGALIEGRIDASGDFFDIYATAGSNGGKADVLIATVRIASDGMPHAIVRMPNDRVTIVGARIIEDELAWRDGAKGRSLISNAAKRRRV